MPLFQFILVEHTSKMLTTNMSWELQLTTHLNLIFVYVIFVQNCQDYYGPISFVQSGDYDLDCVIVDLSKMTL